MDHERKLCAIAKARKKARANKQRKALAAQKKWLA